MTKSQTNRALRLAYTGTTKQVDALEAEMGCALSTILDAAWDDAETAGDSRSGSGRFAAVGASLEQGRHRRGGGGQDRSRCRRRRCRARWRSPAGPATHRRDHREPLQPPRGLLRRAPHLRVAQLRPLHEALRTRLLRTRPTCLLALLRTMGRECARRDANGNFPLHATCV